MQHISRTFSSIQSITFWAWTCANLNFLGGIADKNGHFCHLRPLNHVSAPLQQSAYITLHTFCCQQCRCGNRFGHNQGQNGPFWSSNPWNGCRHNPLSIIYHTRTNNAIKTNILNNKLVEVEDQPGWHQQNSNNSEGAICATTRDVHSNQSDGSPTSLTLLELSEKFMPC